MNGAEARSRFFLFERAFKTRWSVCVDVQQGPRQKIRPSLAVPSGKFAGKRFFALGAAWRKTVKKTRVAQAQYARNRNQQAYSYKSFQGFNGDWRLAVNSGMTKKLGDRRLFNQYSLDRNTKLFGGAVCTFKNTIVIRAPLQAGMWPPRPGAMPNFRKIRAVLCGFVCETTG